MEPRILNPVLKNKPVNHVQLTLENILGKDVEIISAATVHGGFLVGYISDEIEQSMFIKNSQIVEAKRKYEEETGNCATCSGNKLVWSGWSVTDGVSYVKCKSCQ